jgi:hypothetical protein
MPTPQRLPLPAPTARRCPARIAAGVCVALACAAAPARGQTAYGPAATPAAPAVSIEALVQRLDQLETEVRDLRQQLAAARAATPAVPAAPRPADSTLGTVAAAPLLPAAEAHAHGAGEVPADDAAAGLDWKAPTTQVHWFSDVGYSVSSRNATTSSFGLGQLVLFLTSKLSDDWSVLSEIVFRANSDNRFVVNAERLLVQYEPNDTLQVGVGRFHSAVGYYNAAYHHGSWFETAATRPTLFGAGHGPFHNVGVSTRVRVPSGAAGLEAIAELGNGLTSGSRALEPTQNVVDENNHKATNLALVTKPAALPGFQAGVSWYHDQLRPTGVTEMTAHTLAAHVVYTGTAWELLNEIVAARHDDEGDGPVRTSYGWYSQASYRLGAVRPYARYQVVQGHAQDPVFGGLGHRYGPVLGVRVDFSRFAAIKLHVDRSRQSTTGVTSHDGVVKLAFTF